jgi:hypothetical protein
MFLRRELRVWSLVDVEFLTTYILSLLKAIDMRSEPFVQLLSNFLDGPTTDYPHAAEHLMHELYSFLRSPYKDLKRYDDFAQVSQSFGSTEHGADDAVRSCPDTGFAVTESLFWLAAVFTEKTIEISVNLPSASAPIIATSRSATKGYLHHVAFPGCQAMERARYVPRPRV